MWRRCRPRNDHVALVCQRALSRPRDPRKLPLSTPTAALRHHPPATTRALATLHTPYLLPSGPLSFALAVTLDDDRLPWPLDPTTVHRLMWPTLVTIAASSWCMAPATAPLIRCMPSLATASRSASGLSAALLPQPSPPVRSHVSHKPPPLQASGQSPHRAPSPEPRASGNSPERYNEALDPPVLVHRLFRRLDTGYLKPIFGGNGSCLP